MFDFYTVIEVNCTFWKFNCSAKLPQKKKHETFTESFNDMQRGVINIYNSHIASAVIELLSDVTVI